MPDSFLRARSAKQGRVGIPKKSSRSPLLGAAGSQPFRLKLMPFSYFPNLLRLPRSHIFSHPPEALALTPAIASTSDEEPLRRLPIECSGRPGSHPTILLVDRPVRHD